MEHHIKYYWQPHEKDLSMCRKGSLIWSWRNLGYNICDFYLITNNPPILYIKIHLLCVICTSMCFFRDEKTNMRFAEIKKGKSLGWNIMSLWWVSDFKMKNELHNCVIRFSFCTDTSIYISSVIFTIHICSENKGKHHLYVIATRNLHQINKMIMLYQVDSWLIAFK